MLQNTQQVSIKTQVVGLWNLPVWRFQVRMVVVGCRYDDQHPVSLAGIPRSYVEAQEDYLRREAKLLKREGTSPPPPPPPRDLAEAYKARPLEALGPLKLKPAHEGLVATVKEAGRSIHEIPREELRHTPELPLAPRPLKEGSITQVQVQELGGLGQEKAAAGHCPVLHNGETEAQFA